MKIAVPKPTQQGERRVALVPESCARLKKAGFDIQVESDAGRDAAFPNNEYEKAGATIVSDRQALLSAADAVIMVQPPTADDPLHMRTGAMLFSVLSPLTEHDRTRRLAEQGIVAIAMDMMPRISRAQKMDVLSAMSTVAGYKAVLIAANEQSRMFPMMMTAAGTITPVKALILGAGVAGLQAIATAKRLGAVVEAFDVRPAVKEQVESLGARFIEVEAPSEDAEDAGGYAREMSEAYKQKQSEAIARHASESDVVISTALIPGKPAPRLITAETVRNMRPGAVIVDLAAEMGGNCELTRPGEHVKEGGVTIIGPTNLPSSIPYHASQMFSRNVTSFILDISKDGRIDLDMDDECVAGTVITQNGEVVHTRVRELMGLDIAVAPEGSQPA